MSIKVANRAIALALSAHEYKMAYLRLKEARASANPNKHAIRDATSYYLLARACFDVDMADLQKAAAPKEKS